MPSNNNRRRRARSLVVGATALLVAGPLPGLTAAAAAGPANLVVTSASVDRAKVAEGAVLRVTHVVRNSGSAKAGASETRFYLSTDVAASRAARKASRTNPRSAPLDIRLIGRSPVKPLAGGRTVKLKTVKVAVPVGTTAGSYSVLACTDDRGKVKEKNEVDNCTVAAKALKVQPAKGSGSLVLQQFADSDRWPSSEDPNVDFMKLFCSAVQPVEAMTLKGALASATETIEKTVGAGALEQLRSSGQADTAVEAQELAGVAVAKGTPGLALASLMRAHGLEPGNGTHLVNAAAMATSVGLPNEAIAFLDAAQLRAMHRPAFGVSQHAIALTVRGQALVMTGRVAEAEKMFLAAKSAEPLLSEADAGLATIEACKGNDQIAARYIRKSRQRSQKKDTTEPDEEIERPAPQIDLTFGRVTSLRSFPIAETPAQGVKMEPRYQQMREELDAELQANNDEYDELALLLRDTDELRTPAEKQRRSAIQRLMYDVVNDPVVAGLDDKADDLSWRLTQMMADWWGSGTATDDWVYHQLHGAATDACVGSQEEWSLCVLKEMNRTCRPELTGAHSQWRSIMGQLESALQQELAAYSQRVSALAANLEDREAHRMATISIENYEILAASALAGHAQGWTMYEEMYEENCVAPLQAEVVEPGASQGAQSAGPCPKHIAAMNWVAVLGPTKIKVTCEKVSQEISAEVLPLVHAFGEMSYHFRTGKVTVFAGSKGEGKLGVVEGGFKSGVYLTSDGRGGIEDVGWRVGPSASVAEGAAEFQVVEDMVDLSFVSALKTGP